MNQFSIKLTVVLDKVRTLCKQSQIDNIPSRSAQSDSFSQQGILDEHIRALDQLRGRFKYYHEIVNEYKKLQEALQMRQTEIRKKIGVEQQLKLYIDTLKFQYQESEEDRHHLLENAKRIIKGLKKDNQELFMKITTLQNISKAEKQDKKQHNTHQKMKTQQIYSISKTHRLKRNHDHSFLQSDQAPNHFSDFSNQVIDYNFSLKKNNLSQIRKKNFTDQTLTKVQQKKNKDTNKKQIGLFSDGKKMIKNSGLKHFKSERKKQNRSVFSLPDNQTKHEKTTNLNFGKEDKLMKIDKKEGSGSSKGFYMYTEGKKIK